MAKDLIEMKRAPERPMEVASAPSGDAPVYPWGLQLTLDNESLRQLGMDALPDAGAVFTVTARACVTAVAQDERAGPGGTPVAHRRLELQIEALALAPGKRPAEPKPRGWDRSMYEGQ